MLSEIDYSSYLDFSPFGNTENCRKSQNIRTNIKKAAKPVISNIVEHICANFPNAFEEFLGEDVLLVPTPRSSPVVPQGVWPPLTICEKLLANGLGAEVSQCLVRTVAVQKSSTADKGKRATPLEHYDSLEASGNLIAPERILVVDDIVSKGATLIAAVSRVQEAFPNSNVKAFAVMRTKSFDKEIELLNPAASIIKFYRSSGKVWRED